MTRSLLLAAIALAAAAPASAQSFLYDTRWYVGLRENVIELQERQRARVAALAERRRAEAQVPAVAAAAVAPTPDGRDAPVDGAR